MALYVVTGGAGFIGSHLVDALLRRGHAVRVVDDLSTGLRRNLDPRAELRVADIAAPGVMALALQGAAGCFHLAAIASVARGNADWIGTHRVNQGGAIAVFAAARDAGRLPVVYASSAAVYGHQPNEPALHEGLLPQPLSAYGADKLGCELHARVALQVHGVPTLGLRFFNVYGPRQDPRSPYSGVISIFADRLAAGRPLTIEGDGQQSRDFIYVEDVVEHLLAGMDRLERRGECAVFNVCTGAATSILTLAQILNQVLNGASGFDEADLDDPLLDAPLLDSPADLAARMRTPPIRFAPARPGDIRLSVGNPAAARQALRVPQPTLLSDGLALLVDSMQTLEAAD